MYGNRLRTVLIGAIVLFNLAPAEASERVERSTVLMMGKPAGFQEARYGEDGRVAVHFEFNDRGRGPKLDGHYTLDPDGTLASARIEGVAYFKTPVQESFSRTATETRWQNKSEQESRQERAPGFYTTLDGTPEELILLSRALIAAPEHRLHLLPVGEVSIRKVQEQPVKAGKQKLRAVLWALDGLDLTPTYLWLDQNQRFLASYSSWQSMVREGFESALESLGAAQNQASTALIERRAATLTHRLSDDLLIEHARVFDPLDGSIAEDQSLLIRAGRIVAVAGSGTLTASAGATRIDAKGQFAMPGLWDMHVHVGDNDGLLHLAGGVTTVRDLANDRDSLSARIAAFESGKDLGPRVIRAGFIDGRSPYSGPTKVFADTEDEARAALAQFKKDGVFEQVKVYSSLKPELVPLIAKLAHEQGMRLSGHVPDGMSPEQFVEAGADEIQHVNFLMLNFLDRSKIDTRTPQRFTAVADQGIEVDLNSPAVAHFIALLRQHGTVLDPTVMTFEGMFLDRPGRMGPTHDETVHRFPTTWQRFLRSGNGGLEVTPATDLVHRRSYRKMLDLVGLMHRSGVTLVAGTDALVPFALARELELYTHAGIPPKDALKIATLQSAKVMKRDRDYGRLAAGYVADLILIDGDPTQLITDLRRVRTVVRGDRWFESAALYQAVGMQP